MTEIWPDYVAQAFLPPPGLNRQFQDVGSDRVNVSPKEFLWNPSFNANLFFFRDSGYLNLTKTSESDVWER